MFNRITVIGHLCADPEVRATSDGKPVASLRVATNTYGGTDEKGQRKEYTDYHTLVLFGRLAEVAGTYLRKGRLVFAEGRVQYKSWEGQDGHRRYATEIITETLQMLGPKHESGEAVGAA
jgi:single-strand DNA-binding protein